MTTVNQLETYFFEEVPVLVSQLKHEALPEWGTMNAAKMVDHLGDALKLSMGEYTISEASINEKWEKYKAITLISDRPIPKGFDNPILKLLQKTNAVELEAAKLKLTNNFLRFKQTFEEKGPNFKTPHNMFGYLTYHEWLWFHYKHFSHHFAQFGLIPYVERFSLQ